jgi:hypothetical protein
MTKLQVWTLGIFIVLSLILSGTNEARGGEWADSPNNWNNSSSNWENSSSNWANSPNNWDNSPNKRGNDRTLYDDDSEVGYGIPRDTGGINLYGFDGDREGYTP